MDNPESVQTNVSIDCDRQVDLIKNTQEVKNLSTVRGNGASPGSLALNQLLLAGVGRVTVHTLLIAMEQIGQRVLFMHIGRCDHCAVRQPALAVQADVQLHAKVPLLASIVFKNSSRRVGLR